MGGGAGAGVCVAVVVVVVYLASRQDAEHRVDASHKNGHFLVDLLQDVGSVGRARRAMHNWVILKHPAFKQDL